MLQASWTNFKLLGAIAFRYLLTVSMTISPFGQCMIPASCLCHPVNVGGDPIQCGCHALKVAKEKNCCSKDVSGKQAVTQRQTCPLSCCGNSIKLLDCPTQSSGSQVKLTHGECSCGCQQNLPPTEVNAVSAKSETELVDVKSAISFQPILFQTHPFAFVLALRQALPELAVHSSNERCARFCRWII